MTGALAAATVRPARAADPIRIGYFGPLTGNFSQTGKDMTDGFNLFWEEVGNKVAGREVKVIVEDSDPELIRRGQASEQRIPTTVDIRPVLEAYLQAEQEKTAWWAKA